MIAGGKVLKVVEVPVSNIFVDYGRPGTDDFTVVGSIF